MFYIKIMYILNKRKYNYMNSKVEKKRAFLIDLLYAVAIMALIYVFFKYCFAVAAPFLLSFFFAVILQRPIRWLDKKTKNKYHTFWSILLVLLCVAIILGPVISIIAALFKKSVILLHI